VRHFSSRGSALNLHVQGRSDLGQLGVSGMVVPNWSWGNRLEACGLDSACFGRLVRERDNEYGGFVKGV
jgi:hypothetical protein